MTISAISVRFDEHTMWVELADGRTLGVPLAWFPRLSRATPAEREQVELSCNGLHWEAIDEDISVAGLLVGRSAGIRGVNMNPARKNLPASIAACATRTKAASPAIKRSKPRS